MHGFGYKDERFSPGLYVAEDGQSMIGTYVDDCIIAASNPGLLEHITSLIASKISVKTVATMQDDIFEADVPGIDLHYDKKRGMVSLSLEMYIETVVKTFCDDIVNMEKNRRSASIFHPNIIHSTVLCVIFVLQVIVISDIRMSYGTSDTTVILSPKIEAPHLNTTIVSAAP